MQSIFFLLVVSLLLVNFISSKPWDSIDVIRLRTNNATGGGQLLNFTSNETTVGTKKPYLTTIVVGKPLFHDRRGRHRVGGQRRNGLQSGRENDQSEFQQQMLDAHNHHRARHCVQSLYLDEELSQSAQNYAAHLAAIGYLEHSGAEGVGENLWMISSSGEINRIDGVDATNDWYNEIRLYDFNNPDYSDETGHFTQLVWKDSERLGAGYALSSDGQSLFVVAQYSSPGNIIGSFAENVLVDSC